MLIVNPTAGKEKAPEFAKQLEKKLNSYFDEVLLKETQKPLDATRFARQACDDHFDSVFVMGGDGTVSEAISGLAEQNHRPKFGFIPMGTTNDMGHSLNLSMDPTTAIEALDFERTTKLDVGKVNDEYFMNVIGIGDIPYAVNNTSIEKKAKLGHAAYIVDAFKEILDYKTHTFVTTVDQISREIETSLIIIALGPVVGGFENVFKYARVNDGKLHFAYIKDKNFFDTVKALPDVLKGIEKSTKAIGYKALEHISIESVDEDDKVGISADGDNLDQMPLDIRVLASHIDVYRGPYQDEV